MNEKNCLQSKGISGREYLESCAGDGIGINSIGQSQIPMEKHKISKESRSSIMAGPNVICVLGSGDIIF